MPGFSLRASIKEDVKLMIEYHQVIAGLLSNPTLPDVIGKLADTDFRKELKHNLHSNEAMVLKNLGLTLPTGSKVIFHTSDAGYRIEIHIPIEEYRMVVGLDSLTGFFDEIHAA